MMPIHTPQGYRNWSSVCHAFEADPGSGTISARLQYNNGASTIMLPMLWRLQLLKQGRSWPRTVNTEEQGYAVAGNLCVHHSKQADEEGSIIFPVGLDHHSPHHFTDLLLCCNDTKHAQPGEGINSSFHIWLVDSMCVCCCLVGQGKPPVYGPALT